MCFFGKKKVADKTKADRELIETNSKAIDTLIVLAKSNDELIASLRELQEKLKYLVPTDNSKVVDYDKTIKNKIDDLRIALSKGDSADSRKVSNLVADINCAISDRNTRL